MNALVSRAILASFCIVICACGSETEGQKVELPGDPKRVIGRLKWTITEAATGQQIGRGERDILSGEVRATLMDAGMDLTSYVIPLSDHFTVSLANSKDDTVGFGLSVGRDNEQVFGWDWFQVSGKTATKLQESGQLAVAFDGGRVNKIEFQTDVSLRAHPMTEATDVQNPKWRILIAKGSHLSIPK